MYRKISNIAERELMEKELGVPFKFPKLYSPNSVINGTDESTLSIITVENPDYISYAIWGLLPNNFVDEWMDFQNILNTLTVSKENLNSNGIFQEPYHKRRCLIIVTGFFTYHLYNGSLYPYYIYQANNKPFCIAGIYNTLEDGFITSSMLMTKATGIIKKIQNLNSDMPVLIPKTFYNTWLDNTADMNEIHHIINQHNLIELKAHPIAKEFFKNGISYETMLEPVEYKGIPLV